MLPPVHVMAGTMPCHGHSRLSHLNRHKPPLDDTHLSGGPLQVVDLVKPTVFYAEMIEPCAGDSKGISASDRLEGAWLWWPPTLHLKKALRAEL